MATISSHLKCPTCLQEYNIPKLLPCLHSVCQKCLEKCIENSTMSEEKLYQFQCPVCMKIVTKPLSDMPIDQWVGHFPVNAVLLSLLPKVKAKVDQICDPCLYEGASIAAKSYCATCKEALCELCDSAHRKSRASREHTFLTINETADHQVAASLAFGITCTYHLNIDMNFYCASHDSVCCSDCIIDYHRGCSEILKLKKHADKLFKAEEPLMMTERIKQLDGHLDKYTVASNGTLQKLEISTKDMTIEIDKLIATLNEAKSKISMEREALLEEESRKRRNESQQCQSLKAALEDSLILLSAVVKYGNKHQNLVILHKIKEQLAYCEKTIHDKYSEVRQVEARLQLNKHLILLRKITGSQIARITMAENKLSLPFQHNYDVSSDPMQAMSDEGLSFISTMPRDLASDEDDNAVEKSSDFDGQKITESDSSCTIFEISEVNTDGYNMSLEPIRNKGETLITSEDAADGGKLCMKPHTAEKKDMQVCIDADFDADEFSMSAHEKEHTVGRLKLPDPVELKDLNPLILMFLMKNEKQRQIFELNLSDVNGVAKWPSSLEDYVIIKCTVKVEDKSANSFLKDWSIKVVDKVKNFAAGIEVAEFNLIQVAWLRVLEELQTIIIDNSEDVRVFVDQEKYKITVAGPKAVVEKLKKTITVIIAKVETQIELEKQRVTETKSMKTYQMSLLRVSRFKEDIEQMYPSLSFDLKLKDKRAVFVGQADVVQKAILKMHEKLQSFVSNSMQMSKAARNMLFVKEIIDYIKQKMISQKMIGVWDVVRKEEIIMFARDEREVQKAIKLVRDCLVEKEIPLDDVMAQNVKGQQWLQLVGTIQEKNNRKVAIETSMTSILIVALDDIFQDVFNEIKGYFEKHSVQDVFLTLDQVRLKFIKSYKMNDIKALEKRCESSHIKLFIIDNGDQKGVKITGTKDGCKVLKSVLAEMAKNVSIKEHVMVDKVGFKELLQSFKGRDHLRSVEYKYKCFIEMKHSSTSGGMQLEASELPSSFKEMSRQSNLVFCITIDSELNFKAVVQELEGFVKNETIEKEINSPRKIISELLDRQVTKMEGMSQGKTIVSVYRQKGVIHMSGTHKEVLETYDTIVKYLHNIERDKMKEEQEKLKALQDTSDLSLPSSWTKMAPKENMKCVTLNPGDKEYRDVSQKFLASAGGAGQPVAAYAYGINFGSPMNYGSSRLTVVQIERVQNKTLYQQYKAKKRLMETQNKGVANEKELWHGTASTNIPNISNNGFNRSYGGSGSCGAGTYFAVNASHSVSGYCPPDPRGHRHIYLASVLTGDSVVAGAQTRVLPPKDPRFPHITYDSTTDNRINPQMFVIFHDTQAYPSYHITFC